MQESSYPCSVIMKHGETSHNLNTSPSDVLDTCNTAELMPIPMETPSEESPLTDVPIFDLVNFKSWPQNDSGIVQEGQMETNSNISSPKKLKKKNTFSSTFNKTQGIIKKKTNKTEFGKNNCSDDPSHVITKHGETSHNLNTTPSDVLDTCNTAELMPIPMETPSEESPLTDVPIFDLVNFKSWPQNDAGIVQEGQMETNSNISSPKKLKKKNTFSSTFNKTQGVIKKKANKTEFGKNNCSDDSHQQFSCQKCGTCHIVDPTRSRLNQSQKRNPYPRRIIDPFTNNTMIVCNACGLTKSQKEKFQRILPSEEDKQKYLAEASDFAQSLANSLQNTDAKRLYCPTFKIKPCRCLQIYINSGGPEDIQRRATYFLDLIKNANELSKLKNTVPNETEVVNENDMNTTKCKQKRRKLNSPRGVLKRKSKEFEEFVLSNRTRLKKEIGLCERACQKILLYSNNFIHKHLKSSPNKGPRVERICGKNIRGLLNPISELASLNCCGDQCVSLALTHPRLLEAWRTEAASGQRRARRVLAEMLTPSGGTKANCYKFISLVTGCSYTTICLVNEQMRRTKGEREPPEHGLKKWWRENNKTTKKNQIDATQNSNSDQEDDPVKKSTKSLLAQERQRVEELQRQLAKHKQRLQKLEQQAGASSRLQPSLETSTAKANTTEYSQLHSTGISILPASIDFEPVSTISVSLPTLNNVVIIPEGTVVGQEATSLLRASGSPITFTLFDHFVAR